MRSASSCGERTSPELQRGTRVSRLLIKSEKHSEALPLIADLLTKFPTSAELLALQGECCWKLGHCTKVTNACCMPKSDSKTTDVLLGHCQLNQSSTD